MKKSCGTAVSSLCAALLLVAGVMSTVHAGTILKQFGSFKHVSSIIPAGNQLWLATSGGVVRYDRTTGATKTYTEMSDIPDLNVTAGAIDASGDLWFGDTAGYLIRCHPQTETFTSYNSLAAAGWLIDCMVWDAGFLLIGTSNGLSVFDIARSSFQNVKQFGTLTTVNVSAIRVFGNTIAVVVPDGIAYTVVDTFQNTIFSDPGIWNVIPSPGVVGIVQQADTLAPSPRICQQYGSTIWQYGGSDAGGTGLWLNGSLLNTFPSPVTCVLPLNDSWFALGTRSSFWYMYNPGTKSFQQQIINGPADSYVKGCAIDQSGMLWFIPYDPINGIGQFDERQWTSLTYNNTPSLPPMNTGVPFNCKNAIMVTSKNDVWVSTWADGALWLNRETGVWSAYEDPHSQIYSAVSPIVRYDSNTAAWWTFVSSTCEDSLGFIWVANAQAYNGNFLDVRKPRDNTLWRSINMNLLQWQDNPKFIGPIAANENKGTLTQYIYLGFMPKPDLTGGGMAILSYSSANPLDSQTAIGYLVNPKAVVTGFAAVNDTLVWISAEDGIYKVTNNNATTMTKITTITSSGTFDAIAVGMNGNPVFCKDKDLYSYNDADSSLTNLTKCGTLGTPVNWITVDKKNSAYWIASNSGLYRFVTGDTGVVQTNAAAGSIDVYPNPASRAYLRNNHPMRFTRLNALSPHVRIYDASGTLVRVLTDQNTSIINWNGANNAGNIVIPGVYFYQANSANGKSCRGKIFVIP